MFSYDNKYLWWQGTPFLPRHPPQLEEGFPFLAIFFSLLCINVENAFSTFLAASLFAIIQ